MSTLVCVKYFSRPGAIEQVVDFIQSSVRQLAKQAGACQSYMSVCQDGCQLVVSSLWGDRHQAELFRDTIYDVIHANESIDLALSQMPEYVVCDAVH